MDRRRALAAVNLSLAGALGALCALPVLGPILHPLLRRGREGDRAPFIDVGPVERFAKGDITAVALVHGERDGWVLTPPRPVLGAFVVRGDSAGLQVLSRVCPHLGCNVDRAPRGDPSAAFRCPCHGSRFDRAGRRVESEGERNPAPRDMDPLDHRVDSGRLKVRLIRFRTGRPEREPIA